MREFVCSPFGEKVDLDNPETYSYLPNTTKELRQIMFAEIGMAYTYMYFWHKDVFEKCSQKERVDQLIQNFADNERENYSNVLWYQEQIFLFQDETENMC